MFWGLMLKANRKYSQKIQRPFHLSQAALDVKSCSDDSAIQVLLTSDKSTFVLCTLRLNKVEQVPLDLNFEGGAEISFASQGTGNVHLTGYFVEDFDEFGEGGEDGESDLELEEPEVEQIKKNKKQKKEAKISSPKEVVGNDQDDDDDDDDEDDEDFAENMELNDDSDEDEEVDESDNADDTEDSDEEEEEVQEPKPKQQKMDKPKQNGVEKQQGKQKGKKDQSPIEKQKSVEKNLQGGVKIEDLKVGTGTEAKAGKKVNVYYVGRLKSNNKIFDSSLTGSGFKFSLGRGDVIKGWDIGVAGMKVGGKRKITCPPHMAYGAKGSPPVIPGNSTLVFEVELKNVN